MSYYIDGRNVASNHTQSTKTKAKHREVNEKIGKKTGSTILMKRLGKKQAAQIIQTRNLKMSKQQCINANQ